MRDIAGKRVMVTGAASGIGRGAALAFAAEGSTMLLADIDETGLETVRREVASLHVPCRTYVTDISDIEAVRRMAAAVEEEFGGIDILVNVAGVAVCGPASRIPLEDWRWIVDINIMGAVHTILTFVPGMVERGGGHILNVASLAGLAPVAAITPYTMTKFAMVGLSESLRTELRAAGIGVTAFCPGLTATAIGKHARVRAMSGPAYDRAAKLLELVGKSPERTGRLMVRAVQKDKAVVVTTGFGHLMRGWFRLAPGVFRAVMGVGHRPLGRFLGLPREDCDPGAGIS